MRGVVIFLLAVALWCTPFAQADVLPTMIEWQGEEGDIIETQGEEGDIYVCIDPSSESPNVTLSATDCASGTQAMATITITDHLTGNSIVIHVKMCLEGGCTNSVCTAVSCEPECVAHVLCVQVACRWGPCPWL